MTTFGQQGWSQQTPAVQALLGQAFGSVKRAASRKRRKKATKTRAGARRAKRSAGSSKTRARMVKGSAAAKRYMASIRKKRKK